MVAGASQSATRDAPEPGNVVVAFPRRHLGASPAISLTIEADARPAPSASQRRAVLGPAVFPACSLGLHAGLYVLLARPPKPLASVATIAMSVEVMLGADLTAGVDKRPTEAEAMTTASVVDEPRGVPDPVMQPETSEPRPVEQAIPEPAS